MKIALLGYGKMGKAIERIALQRGHQITLKIDDGDSFNQLSKADVAIEFSTPHSAFHNVTQCFESQLPVICGTTGWLDRYVEAEQLCKKKEGAFIYASNFSLGVNLFFQLNQYLARMMTQFNDYEVSIEEMHHTEKVDRPAGTAITLAEQIIKNSNKKAWTLNQAKPAEIPITCQRFGELPGTHIVNYKSDIDEITIKHEARSRDGFALGAVLAAEWIIDKKGVFSMQDVLNLNIL